MIKRLVIWFGALAILALPAGLFAATSLTLVGPINGNTDGPQSASNPCIIAGTPSQQPPGFGFDNFVQGGNQSSFDPYSPTPTASLAGGVLGNPYTVSQLDAAVGASFNVAILTSIQRSIERRWTYLRSSCAAPLRVLVQRCFTVVLVPALSRRLSAKSPLD